MDFIYKFSDYFRFIPFSALMHLAGSVDWLALDGLSIHECLYAPINMKTLRREEKNLKEK